MSDHRVKVWLLRPKGRTSLMLQWVDPDTRRRKSRSAGTDDEEKAERARADLEYELNRGRYKEASRMTWERFREVFEDESLPGVRPSTARNFRNTFDLLEQTCNPSTLRSVSTRMVSRYVAELRKLPGRTRGNCMMASTIAVRLAFLHAALAWALEQKMIA
jgi:hypothetical protein